MTCREICLTRNKKNLEHVFKRPSAARERSANAVSYSSLIVAKVFEKRMGKFQHTVFVFIALVVMACIASTIVQAEKDMKMKHVPHAMTLNLDKKGILNTPEQWEKILKKDKARAHWIAVELRGHRSQKISLTEEKKI